MEDIDTAWQYLKTQRDELRLQIHLANAELREEIESLEPKWQEAKRDYENWRSDTAETAHDLQETLAIVIDELSKAIMRFKSRLD